MKSHNRSQEERSALVTPTAIEHVVSGERSQTEPSQPTVKGNAVKPPHIAEVSPVPEADNKGKPKKRRVAQPIEKTISLRVSEAMLEWLNKEAAIQGQSRSHLIQTAVQDYQGKIERKRAREQEKTG